ncbi:MAG: hypothetical protein KZQ70_15165, partial [gamma proteobacterium symbiont of Lucinoma myriamae]|nr:hypothetical protein [gamma proteobacterium symbiont of Lucinoma myriamae]
MDIAHHRLFKPVLTGSADEENRSFLKINFKNKGLDAINISNILHHKKVTSTVPTYFKPRAPLISYSYTRPIASKIFNYKQTLQDLTTNGHAYNPPVCNCASSAFNYGPAGHVITGDLNIINNVKLKEVLSKGPKYREPQSFTWRQNFKIIMDSVEDYARRWAKLEEVEENTLSEWVKAVRSLVKARISRLQKTMSTKTKSVFSDPDVVSELSTIHDSYVVVPADKASNNIVFVCKAHYCNCLKEELGINSTQGNPTYTRTSFSKDEILDNHKSVLSSFGITCSEEDLELPFLYWIPKLHKNPYKQRYIAGSAKCSTKPLSIVLTKILTAVKEGLQKYCSTAYSRSGVNQMWILKNSKELLENLKSLSFSKVHSIKTFDFSTLYTTIPHNKLKSRLKDLITHCFFHKNGTRRYKYVVLGPLKTYFVKDHSDCKVKYSETDIVRMLEFLIDNIFVMFDGQIFQQTIGIPMGTNCAPLLADLFLYSYEAEFIQGLLKSGKKKLAQRFNFTYRYIDDVISLNNPKFSEFLDFIYPCELEIKDTTESNAS